MENHEKFQRRRTEIYHLKTRIIRIGGTFTAPGQTYENMKTEAEKIVPEMLKSKKQDVESEIAEYDFAIASKQESISEENRLRIEGNERSVEIRCHWGSYYKSVRNWEQHEKETKGEIALLTAWREFLRAVIAMYDRKLKKRENPKAVQTIMKQAQELTSEHKQLTQKIRKILEKPIEILNFITAETFIQKRERMRIVESELHVLEDKFDWNKTPPETIFPSLDGLTSIELQYDPYRYYSETNAVIKEIERIYREETEKRKEAKA